MDQFQSIWFKAWLRRVYSRYYFGNVCAWTSVYVFHFFHKTNFVLFFTILLFIGRDLFLFSLTNGGHWTPTLCEGCQKPINWLKEQTLYESRKTKVPKVSSKTNPQSTAHASGLAADLLTGDSVTWHRKSTPYVRQTK
jgi:hypothetical protein